MFMHRRLLPSLVVSYLRTKSPKFVSRCGALMSVILTATIYTRHPQGQIIYLQSQPVTYRNDTDRDLSFRQEVRGPHPRTDATNLILVACYTQVELLLFDRLRYTRNRASDFRPTSTKRRGLWKVHSVHSFHSRGRSARNNVVASSSHHRGGENETSWDFICPVYIRTSETGITISQEPSQCTNPDPTIGQTIAFSASPPISRCDCGQKWDVQIPSTCSSSCPSHQDTL